jgi:Staphylococcal nuclease homologue
LPLSMPRKKASRSVNEPKRPCSELVFGKDVGLLPHSIDRYGRLVARVLIDNQDAGLELLKRGLCPMYGKYVTEAPTESNPVTGLLRQPHNLINSASVHPDPVPPWEGRKSGKERFRTVMKRCLEG